MGLSMRQCEKIGWKEVIEREKWHRKFDVVEG
jgi:hypothetical protein